MHRHSLAYAHLRFYMHRDAAANTDSRTQTQMFLHLITASFMPPTHAHTYYMLLLYYPVTDHAFKLH